jgi:hypothetical protein
MVWWPFATKPERADTLEVIDLHSGAPLLYSTSFVVKCLFRFRLRFAALGPLRPAVKYLEISASGIGTHSDGESNSPADHPTSFS